MSKVVCPVCACPEMYVEEKVNGSFTYTIDSETGCIDWEDRDYGGDSFMSLVCDGCGRSFSFEMKTDQFGEDYITIING